jgi:hypothetical protein
VSLYCVPCRQELVVGARACHLCGGCNLACMTCHTPILVGETGCSYCDRREIVRQSPSVPVDVSEDVAQALASVPTPVRSLGTAVVSEVYKAGRYGVEAVVKIPPRDAEIMTELCRLVPLLHGMAARLNQFQGHTEHTRALIRDLRKVACDAQEEVELRRGPG